MLKQGGHYSRVGHQNFKQVCNASNWAWKNIRCNIKISAKGNVHTYEWKEQKTWFDIECL
jgi:hypothetical protein